MPEHESTFPASAPPPGTGPDPLPPAARDPYPAVEWVHCDTRNHLAVVCLREGRTTLPSVIVALAKALDEEVFSIALLSGPWLLGGYYLGPQGWLTLEPPEYHLAH